MTKLVSLLIASCKEVREALEQGFTFPAMGIPFGADETTPCRFFNSSDEMSEDDLSVLLENSYPMIDKVRRVHLISVPQTGITHFTPDPIFYLFVT